MNRRALEWLLFTEKRNEIKSKVHLAWYEILLEDYNGEYEYDVDTWGEPKEFEFVSDTRGRILVQVYKKLDDELERFEVYDCFEDEGIFGTESQIIRDMDGLEPEFIDGVIQKIQEFKNECSF